MTGVRRSQDVRNDRAYSQSSAVSHANLVEIYLANKESVEAYLGDQERLADEIAANQTPLPESSPRSFGVPEKRYCRGPLEGPLPGG